MSILSRIAGFTCRDCGAALPYFQMFATQQDRNGNRREAAIACPSCGANMRLTSEQGPARFWRWIVSRVPSAVLLAIGFAVVLYLYSEPRKDPALVSVIILGLALSFVPALLLSVAFHERVQHGIEKAED